ncbi:hypothetical protein ACFL6U_19295 [Planctomycetota bacterium]
MFNVFEYPWLLLIVAFVAFLVVGTWRAICPDQQRKWQLAIPFVIALMAILLDLSIATDREQVNALTRNLLRATAHEDVDTLGTLIAADYQDPRHPDRVVLLKHFRAMMEHSSLVKITKQTHDLESLHPPRAELVLGLILLFEEKSRIASLYKAFFFITVKLDMEKQDDGSWKLTSIELREVDRTPMTWSQIPSTI